MEDNNILLRHFSLYGALIFTCLQYVKETHDSFRTVAQPTNSGATDHSLFIPIQIVTATIVLRNY